MRAELPDAGTRAWPTFNVCRTGKVPFPSRGDAIARATAFNSAEERRTLERPDGTLLVRRQEAYICDHCRQWHVGGKWAKTSENVAP